MAIKRFIPVLIFVILAVSAGVLIQRSIAEANTPLLPPDHPKVVAGQEPEVTLYSTDWCGYCRAARTYLTRKGVPFIEKDIEKDPAAHRTFKALGGSGVPLITIDQARLTGFDQGRFREVYLAAAND